MHVHITFPNCDAESAYEDVTVSWRGITNESVSVALFVEHEFLRGGSLRLCLHIVAARVDNKEDFESTHRDFHEVEFPFYPPHDQPIPLTLKDVRRSEDEDILAIFTEVENMMHEKFLRDLVAATICILRMSEETGTLTATLCFKESGTKLLETEFSRTRRHG